MKKYLIIIAVLVSSIAFSQSQTTHRVTSIANMKTYSGVSSRVHVTATNEDFVNSPASTPDEATIYDGAGSRVWKKVIDNSRQATLVSGTNIKTVNGTTLLGSGDFTIGIDDVLAEAQALTAGRVLEVGDANFFDISVNGIPFFEVIGGSKSVSLGPFVQVGDDEMNVKLNLTTDVGAELKYGFDNGVVQKEAKIVGFADATTATITHTADKHIFTGDELVFLEGEEQLLWITPGIFQTKLMATDGDARSQVQLIAELGVGVTLQLRSDDGSVNEAEIVLNGGNATAQYQALNGHNFTLGFVKITSLAGGGTTGLSIDNDGKIIRTP